MATNNLYNDMVDQLAALQATIADMQEQLAYLFRLHGHTWARIQKQQRDNAKAGG
jgi:hypothetical protein